MMSETVINFIVILVTYGLSKSDQESSLRLYLESFYRPPHASQVLKIILNEYEATKGEIIFSAYGQTNSDPLANRYNE